MTSIGKKGRETQDRLIALFNYELKYRYLGHWTDHENKRKDACQKIK